jgi:hypothetical protein
MVLQLYITKHYGLKYRSKGLQIKFAVIDLDKALTYPQNFLCMLPKLINPKLKQKHKFVELFGDKSLQIAYDLLTKALDTEIDVDVIQAIEKRLKKLNIKTASKVRCRLCSQFFQPKGKSGPSRMCNDCKKRIYAVQKLP